MQPLILLAVVSMLVLYVLIIAACSGTLITVAMFSTQHAASR
jgi:hypothetical protein